MEHIAEFVKFPFIGCRSKPEVVPEFLHILDAVKHDEFKVRTRGFDFPQRRRISIMIPVFPRMGLTDAERHRFDDHGIQSERRHPAVVDAVFIVRIEIPLGP